MPGRRGSWVSRVLLVLIMATLVFGFSPISRQLLRSVNGSFAPTPYSSLGLVSPTSATTSMPIGLPVLVELTNHTGHSEVYHWMAEERGALISQGRQRVSSGGSVPLSVPTRRAVAGELRIVLNGTKVFLTVPLVKSTS
jgi:hypothetical protein